jgi:integrase
MARKITGTRLMKNGTRQIYVFIERRKRNGKTERVSKTEITTLTRASDIEARRKEMRSELLAEIAAAKNKLAAQELLLIEYLDKWLAEICTGKLAVRTLSDYKYHIKHYLAPYLNKNNPDLLLKDVSPMLLHDLFVWMKKRGKNYAVSKMKQILSAACTNAVLWGILKYNPVAGVRIELPEKKVRKILSPDDARRFLRFCDSLPLELCLMTGLRPSELVALSWTDIDFQTNKIRVAQSLVRTDGGGYQFKQPKSKNSIRAISISETLAEKLKLHKKKQLNLIAYRKEKNYLFENLGLVFCSRFGTPLHIHNLNTRELKKILELAGLPSDISLYSLRHSMCSLLLGSGANLKDVSERMGHADVRITLKTYTHSLPEADKKLTDLFSRIIDEKEIIPGSGIIEVSGKAN